MVFSSITFLLFFIPVVLTVFYILPAADRYFRAIMPFKNTSLPK